jgi:hypothetical protein
MARLTVVVPASRKHCGRLVLLSSGGETLLRPVRILARASRRIGRKHGNPTCARELPFGDPPAGSYEITGSLPPDTAHRRPRRFGRLGALLLAPRAGEAFASRVNGRSVFALHGGPLDSAGRLRPTRGGLRLADDDLAALFDAVNAAHERGDAVAGLDLVDVPDDAVGLSPDGRSAAVRTPLGWADRTLGLAVLLGGIAGAAGERSRAVSRRRFITSALLLVGGLGASACDLSSPCDGPACDPGDGGGGGSPVVIAGPGDGSPDDGSPDDYSSGGGTG